MRLARCIAFEAGWSVDINFTESRFSASKALIGPQADSPWLNMVPWGFYRTLRWSHDRYANAGSSMDTSVGTSVGVSSKVTREGESTSQPNSGSNNKKPFKIYVTENGCDVPGESLLPRELALRDVFR